MAAAVNHSSGEVVAGSAFVPVGALGSICVYTKAADADIVVDLTATLWADAAMILNAWRLFDSAGRPAAGTDETRHA